MQLFLQSLLNAGRLIADCCVILTKCLSQKIVLQNFTCETKKERTHLLHVGAIVQDKMMEEITFGQENKYARARCHCCATHAKLCHQINALNGQN